MPDSPESQKITKPIIAAIHKEQQIQNRDIAALEIETGEIRKGVGPTPFSAATHAANTAASQEAARATVVEERAEAAGVREAEILSSQSSREETALTKIGQRRINFLWEATQAILAIMVPGACLSACLFVIVSPSAEKELKVAAFVAITASMSSITASYFQRTNHTRVGGVPQERRGE